MVPAPTVKKCGGFCWCKGSLPTCPCLGQLAHLDQGEDARVLLNGVTCIVSVLYRQMIFLFIETNNVPFHS